MTITHFHTGHNMPGYLPESDVFQAETFDEAKACLMEEMQWAAESLYDVNEPIGADELEGAQRDLNGSDGPEWGDIAGGLSWWIVPCTDDCNLEED